MAFLLDHVPLWVYIVITIIAVGAVFYFFSPVLIPLWNLTPRWVKVLGSAIATIFGAYVAGRYRGSKDERDRTAQANAEAIKRRQEIDQNVDKASDTDVDGRLSKFMRDR